ncbi:MAG TPA: hypothetical protein VF721_10080 [Pyrinomonadaceae bacterium]|jgi:hypothetical protein
MSKKNRNLFPKPKVNTKSNIFERIIDEEREIPIRRVIPPDLPVLYSDGLVVQNRNGMFTLYFFQAKHPLAFTTEEVNNIKSVDTVCVAQILLTPKQMEENIKAMTANLERLRAETSKLKEESKVDEEPENSKEDI